MELEGFHVEVRPEGDLLLYRNIDKPGVLARVGGVLASHGVNIAGVSLGRTGEGAEAMTVMNLDSPISSLLLEELRRLEGVTSVVSVRL
jgi:D-3-phosphoglycerate dehydrogenase